LVDLLAVRKVELKVVMLDEIMVGKLVEQLVVLMAAMLVMM
jgi:hypothetical protein